MISFRRLITLILILLVTSGFSVEWKITAKDNLPPGLPTLVFPANSATQVVPSPELQVKVSDPDGDQLTVTFYGRPREPLAPEPDFTMVVLPDTQAYTYLSGGAAIFEEQTQWIVDNREARNIVSVSHVGDLTESGNYDTDHSEWDIADQAMHILETAPIPGGLPFGIAPGNHDLFLGYDLYEQYFGVDRFTSHPPQPRPYYGGHYGADNRNYYELISAYDLDFLIIYLDSTIIPEAGLLTWANRLMRLYSNRRAILVSHSLVTVGDPAPWISPGQEIFEAIKDNPNLFLLLCGHEPGEGQRVDNYNNTLAYTLLADYQFRPNGGDGLLRILTFSDEDDQIRVETYSTHNQQYETDVDSQFTLTYPMRDDFNIIGTSQKVPSGRTVRLKWDNLAANTDYEWYVSVDDGSLLRLSNLWTFKTEIPTSLKLIDIHASSPSRNYIPDILYLLATTILLTIYGKTKSKKSRESKKPRF